MTNEEIETIQLTSYFLILFSDVIAFFYTILKIYSILCFSKITFDQLPILNPYKGPLSFFRIITKPYFKFWSDRLPNLKLGKVSYDVSAILGLEMLSSLIYLCVQVRTSTFLEAQRLLHTIT